MSYAIALPGRITRTSAGLVWPVLSTTTPGNFDLAAVDFGNLLIANAIGGNFMVDILPSL
jgi:hypothetical protein